MGADPLEQESRDTGGDARRQGAHHKRDGASRMDIHFAAPVAREAAKEGESRSAPSTQAVDTQRCELDAGGAGGSTVAKDLGRFVFGCGSAGGGGSGVQVRKGERRDDSHVCNDNVARRRVPEGEKQVDARTGVGGKDVHFPTRAP